MDAVIPPGDGEIDDRRENPDRRESSRKRTLKAGRTFWPNGDSSECIVCSISDSGAQLELQGPLPRLFDLVIDGDPSRRACAVVWRNASRVGVKFKEPSRSDAAAKNPTRHLRGIKHYVEECRRLAIHASPSDRETLLEMADALTLSLIHI